LIVLGNRLNRQQRTWLLTVLFLAVDVPEMLWTTHLEKGIAKEITQIVEGSAVQQVTQ